MRRELTSYGLRSLGFLIVLEAMLVPAVIFWPSFSENFDSIRRMAALIPMLGEFVGILGDGGIEAYIIGQHFFKGCNTLGTAAAVLFAMGAVAGEAHRGTLEIWLARPISRTRLLTERFLLGLLAVIVPVFLTSLTLPWLLTSVDETMPMAKLMRCAVHQSLFLAAIYSITFLLSAVSSQPTRIAIIMLFFTTLQFAVYMVKTVTHYSLFRLADIETFLEVRTQLDWGIAGLLAATIIATYCAALYAFRRRVP